MFSVPEEVPSGNITKTNKRVSTERSFNIEKTESLDPSHLKTE